MEEVKVQEISSEETDEATKPGGPGFVNIAKVNIIYIMVNIKDAITKYISHAIMCGSVVRDSLVTKMETSGLSICRNPAQPASSRSKAVDSKAAHSFQTVLRPGCVSPVSDNTDRF